SCMWPSAPLIRRLQPARIRGGEHIDCCIEFSFRHPRFPCVRKAALHSGIAEPHRRHRQTDEHLLAFGEAFDGMRVTIKSSEIRFLQGLTPCSTSFRVSIWSLASR